MERRYFKKFGHSCELNDEEENTTANQIKGSFNRWKTVDPMSILALQHFNSYAAIVNEQQSHLRYFPKTLHPFSRIVKVWRWFMLVIFSLGMFCGQLQLFIFVHDNPGEIRKYTRVTILFVRVICMTDMVRRFFTGFVDKDTNNVSHSLCENRLLT